LIIYSHGEHPSIVYYAEAKMTLSCNVSAYAKNIGKIMLNCTRCVRYV